MYCTCLTCCLFLCMHHQALTAGCAPDVFAWCAFAGDLSYANGYAVSVASMCV